MVSVISRLVVLLVVKMIIRGQLPPRSYLSTQSCLDDKDLREEMFLLKCELRKHKDEISDLYAVIQGLKRGVHAQSVSFSVYLGDGFVEIRDGDVVKYIGVEHNEGGHYHVLDGTFTCPMDGAYFFTFTLYSNLYGNCRHMFYDLVLQGRSVADVHCANVSPIDTFVQCSTSAIVHCLTGQKVWVRCTQSCYSLSGGPHGRRSNFTGFLVNADGF